MGCERGEWERERVWERVRKKRVPGEGGREQRMWKEELELDVVFCLNEMHN